MNVGVRRRLFAGATRRAVEVRDRQCFSQFCDVPAEHCQIDHIQPYADGGLTTEANGRPACGVLRPPPAPTNLAAANRAAAKGSTRRNRTYHSRRSPCPSI